MRAPTQKAIMRANTIEWSVGGCDHVSVTRWHDGWAVFDSRGVRQGARLLSEHKSLYSAVNSAMALVDGEEAKR